MVLFFDYGIMTEHRLRDKIGPVKLIGGAVLPGHSLRFVGSSPLFCNGAIASAHPDDKPDRRRPVVGLLYSLHKDQLPLLDIAMEAAFGATFRHTVRVMDGCDCEWTAYAYRSTCRTRGEPSAGYMRLHAALVRTAHESYCAAQMEKKNDI